MKKLKINALLLAGLLSFSACDTGWFEEDAPEAAKARFAELYPSIDNPDWDDEDGYYEAEFRISGRERAALFDAQGQLLQVAEEMEEPNLPAPALEHLRQQYGAYQLEEAHRVLQGETITYQVELEKGSEDLVLYFDNGGQLLAQPQMPQDITALTNAPPDAGANPVATGIAASPEAQWQLPEELREVSAIALLPDGRMACVQDEEGAIYLYNLDKKALEGKVAFAGPGDYEGLAVVGQDAYVLRSDGTLYEVTGFLSGQPKTQQYESALAPTQDTEGLAYDQANNRLLVAGKGYDQKYPNAKTVFAFSLQTKQMQPEPVLSIPLPQKELPIKKKKDRDNIYAALQTSSLEVHPATGELYLLDAANERVMVVSENGEIQKVANLDEELLPQPEGLAFGQNGEMYISSEAGGKKGNPVLVKYGKGL